MMAGVYDTPNKKRGSNLYNNLPMFVCPGNKLHVGLEPQHLGDSRMEEHAKVASITPKMATDQPSTYTEAVQPPVFSRPPRWLGFVRVMQFSTSGVSRIQSPSIGTPFLNSTSKRCSKFRNSLTGPSERIPTRTCSIAFAMHTS